MEYINISLLQNKPKISIKVKRIEKDRKKTKRYKKVKIKDEINFIISTIIHNQYITN